MNRQGGVRAAIIMPAVLLLALGAVRAEVGAGVAFTWPATPLGAGPWPACGPWGCADPVQLRRALRRELREEALRQDLESPLPAGAGGVLFTYPSRADLPPPTPASQVQPRYRESGTVRPKYDRN